APGQISELSMKLADTLAEAAAEREKIERSARRQERVQRDHLAGKITAFYIARMDFDEGDVARAQKLDRRAARVREHTAGAAAAITPQRQEEAAPMAGAVARARDAHGEFVMATRAALAGSAARRRGSGPLSLALAARAPLTARAAPPLARRVPSR